MGEEDHHSHRVSPEMPAAVTGAVVAVNASKGQIAVRLNRRVDVEQIRP
ncbi:unnamed protein product [Arabidopsis lyrata]|nr:unnamed protein product [Arabidopsis lyrata]